ncbi:MAG: D-alanyl-D-alanine endopeptidase [Proteobacteria bacterium]|nr:D-alanyl-D-alanine endopeptidase [Pseudomonadota bacterium]
MKTNIFKIKNYSKLLIIFLSLIFFTISNVHAASSKDALSKKIVNLASVSAAVVDLKSGRTYLKKNANIIMPIASITKIMTAMVVLDSKLSLKEKIRFRKQDKININNYYSRIRIDSTLSRGDVLRIALMSSENLAAAALGHNYPGGLPAFVKAMNKKARQLGMKYSYFVDSSGLSEKNVSTASDLSKMMVAAAKYSTIRKYTTTKVYTANFKKPRYRLAYTNTNALVRGGKWNVKVSKTGYLDEAGRCLVMVTKVNNKDVVMVLLDSFGKRSPTGDAYRIKKWLATGNTGSVAKSAHNYQQSKLKKLKLEQNLSQR